ncbi:GGDEF domain-containing protein [uncultured Alteromonas sp.]|uniref:GGDEF domain-containing protein n=1 Tax=uncultured Alteromonas sp. TaxID=179113 RepID=UPI0025FEA045|nr:GGDEF domain-containing protein [uncultured Alteromonas sp.]
MKRIGERTTSTLAFLDLDKFKQINDQFGHQTGDKALIILTERIKSTMRDNDLVGRYGGDEFLLLLRDTRDYEAQHLIDRIFAEPLIVRSEQSQDIHILCSIGMSQWHYELEGVQQWIEEADKQMYHVKGSKAS